MKGYEKAKSLYNDFWEEEGSSATFDKVKKMEAKAYASCEDLYFGLMVESMINYMKKSYKENPNKKIFRFEGEY